MFGSRNYHNCNSPTAEQFAKKIGITESAVRRLFLPDEWHHCYLKYGNAARAYYYKYTREDVARLIREVRNGGDAQVYNEFGNLEGVKITGAEFLLGYIRARKLFPVTKKTVKRISESVERMQQHWPARLAEENRREQIRWERQQRKIINDPLDGLMDRLKLHLKLKRQAEACAKARLEKARRFALLMQELDGILPLQGNGLMRLIRRRLKTTSPDILYSFSYLPFKITYWGAKNTRQRLSWRQIRKIEGELIR